MTTITFETTVHENVTTPGFSIGDLITGVVEVGDLNDPSIIFDTNTSPNLALFSSAINSWAFDVNDDVFASGDTGRIVVRDQLTDSMTFAIDSGDIDNVFGIPSLVSVRLNGSDTDGSSFVGDSLETALGELGSGSLDNGLNMQLVFSDASRIDVFGSQNVSVQVNGLPPPVSSVPEPSSVSLSLLMVAFAAAAYIRSGGWRRSRVAPAASTNSAPEPVV